MTFIFFHFVVDLLWKAEICKEKFPSFTIDLFSLRARISKKFLSFPQKNYLST